MKYYVKSHGYSAVITRGKAKKILRAFDEVLEISLLEEKYDYLIQNYLELEEDSFRIASRYLVLGSFGVDTFQKDRGLLARRIINLLTTSRIYLDHTPHHLSKIFQANKVSEKFKELTRLQYESSLAYRFSEALRNYVQHRGLPIHSITYGSSVVDYPVDKRVKYLIVPRISLSDLLADGKFKKSVIKEMQAIYDEQLSALPILRSYIESLSVIHEETRKMLEPEIGRVKKFLFDEKKALEENEIAENGNMLLGIEVVDSKGEQVEEKYSSLSLFRSVDELQRKNRKLTRLADRFITSEGDLKNR